MIAGREVVPETSGRAGTLRLQSPEDRFQFLAGDETVLLEGFDTLAQLSEGLGLRLLPADEPLVLRPQAGQALGLPIVSVARAFLKGRGRLVLADEPSKRLFNSACSRVRDSIAPAKGVPVGDGLPCDRHRRSQILQLRPNHGEDD